MSEQRNVKELYYKTRAGEIIDFTGVNASFEIHKNAKLTIKTSKYTIDDCINEILENILSLILMS